MSCTTDPFANVVWMHGGNVVSNSSSTLLTTTNTLSMVQLTLQLSPLSFDQRGEYICCVESLVTIAVTVAVKSKFFTSTVMEARSRSVLAKH